MLSLGIDITAITQQMLTILNIICIKIFSIPQLCVSGCRESGMHSVGFLSL